MSFVCVCVASVCLRPKTKCKPETVFPPPGEIFALEVHTATTHPQPVCDTQKKNADRYIIGKRDHSLGFSCAPFKATIPPKGTLPKFILQFLGSIFAGLQPLTPSGGPHDPTNMMKTAKLIAINSEGLN